MLDAHSAALETVKVTPVAVMVLETLKDNANLLGIALGILYTCILITHKLWQWRKEIKRERESERGGA